MSICRAYTKCLVLFLVTAVFISPAELLAESSLRQVHIIFRHGDRAPVNLYPNDPNEGHVWPFGLGQLSEVGKRQQYELGTFLRDRYDGFFSTNPQEIEVRSSDKDRCIASAQVNLAAFFKPDGIWIWNSSFLWQPVPIHTVPKPQDNLLNEDASCPASDKVVAKIMETPEGQAYAHKYQDLFTFVSEKSGMVVNDPASVLDVYGTIFIEKLNNLIIPEWVDSIWDNLTNAANEAFVVGYASRTYQRLRGGPLLSHMIKLMQKRQDPENAVENPKGFMYSTHDAVISAVLNGMNVFNGRTVPYCATILVELHQENEGNFFVRAFYRNSSDHEPYPLILPACHEECSLADFVTQLQDVTPVDIQEECHNKEEENDTNRSIFSSLTVPVLLISFIWFLLKH